MAAQIVGTAYVRLRVITKQLSKDIEDSLNKGLKDADADALGEKFGDDFSKSATAQIRQNLASGIGNLDIDGEGAGTSFGAEFGRSASTEIGDGIRDGIQIDPDIAAEVGAEVGANFGASFNEGSEDEIDSGFSSFFRRFNWEREGRSSGLSFGRGFGRGGLRSLAPMLIGLAATIGAPLIAAIGQTLGQVIINLVGQVGFLAEALVGAGVAGGVVFGSMLAAVGPLIAALTVASPRLERFKESASVVGEAWKEVAFATQRTLLPGLTRALRRTRALIPMFAEFGEEIGRLAGYFSELFVEILRGETGQRRLQAILSGSTRIFTTVSRSALRLGDILSAIWVAALPAAERFAEVIDQLLENWRLAINEGERTGTLTATFDRLFDRAVLVGGAIADIFIALKNVLVLGADVSGTQFEGLRQWAEDFRAFTESAEGQEKITRIFEDARRVATEFWGLLSDITSLLFSGFSGETTTDGVVGGIRAIRDALPGIADGLGGFVETMREPLSDFAESLGELLTAFQEVGGFAILITTLTLATDVLREFIELPGMAEFIGFLGAMAGAFLILKGLGIVKIFSVLGGVIGAIASAFAGGGAIFGGGLLAGLASIGAALGVVALAIGAIYLLWRNWDTIKEAALDAWEWLEPVREALVDFTENVVEALITAVTWLWEHVLRPFGAWLLENGPKAWDAITKAASWLWEEVLKPFGKWLAEEFQPFWDELVRVYRDEVEPRIRDVAGAISDLYADMVVLYDWLQANWVVIWPAISTFFDEKVKPALDRVAGSIVAVWAGSVLAFNFVREHVFPIIQSWIEGYLDVLLVVFKGVIGMITNFWHVLEDAFFFLRDTVGPILKTFIENTLATLSSIWRDLNEGVEDFKEALEGIGGIVESVVGWLNDIKEAAEDALGPLGGIANSLGGPLGFVLDIANNENGSIIRKPTLTWVGEKNKPEVIIPLTNPARAAQLAQESGLIDMLARQGATTSGSGNVPAATTVGAPLIEHMTLITPDPDRSARAVINSLRGISHAIGPR